MGNFMTFKSIRKEVLTMIRFIKYSNGVEEKQEITDAVQDCSLVLYYIEETLFERLYFIHRVLKFMYSIHMLICLD